MARHAGWACGRAAWSTAARCPHNWRRLRGGASWSRARGRARRGTSRSSRAKQHSPNLLRRPPSLLRWPVLRQTPSLLRWPLPRQPPPMHDRGCRGSRSSDRRRDPRSGRQWGQEGSRRTSPCARPPRETPGWPSLCPAPRSMPWPAPSVRGP
eukprot:2723574-Pyramimonas_sp.AAC.1